MIEPSKIPLNKLIKLVCRDCKKSIDLAIRKRDKLEFKICGLCKRTIETLGVDE